jgi:hypothetical protein
LQKSAEPITSPTRAWINRLIVLTVLIVAGYRWMAGGEGAEGHWPRD